MKYCFLNQALLNSTTHFNSSYLQGETHTSIILTIRNDSSPETHEVFVVRLSNIQTFGVASTGHASFFPGKTTATISISASDRPHGVVELESGSRRVTRQDEKNFTLTVSRLFGKIGMYFCFVFANNGIYFFRP